MRTKDGNARRSMECGKKSDVEIERNDSKFAAVATQNKIVDRSSVRNSCRSVDSIGKFAHSRSSIAVDWILNEPKLPILQIKWDIIFVFECFYVSVAGFYFVLRATKKLCTC